MKTKKTMALIMAAVMTAGAMSGCAGKKEDNGKIKISVGSWPAAEGASLDRMNAKKEAFEKKFPQYEIVPDTWTFELSTFYSKAATGSLPMVYETGLTEVRNIIDNGYSCDITEEFTKRGYMDVLSDRVKDIVTRDGKVYAIPKTVYTLGIGYNVELFEKAGLMNDDGSPIVPKTWDDLAQTAVTIKEKTGKPGFVFPTTNNCGGWMLSPIAWSYGATFMEKGSDGKWKATFDSPEATAALQYIKDLKWKYDVLPSNNLIDFVEMYKTFCSGGAAMQMSGDVISSIISTYEMKPESLGMFALPGGPQRHVTLLGGSVSNISKDATPEQIAGAFEWLNFTGEATPFLSEDAKESIKSDFEQKSSEGKVLLGIRGMSAWSGNSEVENYKREMYEQYHNTNPNNYKYYLDSFDDQNIEIQVEEPIYCQELYSILDAAVQEALTNESSNCAKLMKDACEKFQKTYLDGYEGK